MSYDNNTTPNTAPSIKALARSGHPIDGYVPKGKTFVATFAGYYGRYRVAKVERQSVWVDDRDGADGFGQPYLEERTVIRTASGLYWDATLGRLLSFRQSGYEGAAVTRTYMSSYEDDGTATCGWALGEEPPAKKPAKKREGGTR